ncbi:MAG: ABC transporter substrate-binding protein [Dehalococcoidia bacterium]
MRLRNQHRPSFIRTWLVLSLCAVLALAVVACGDDDDDDATATSPSGNTPTQSGASPTIDDQPGSVDVLGIWGGDELTKFEDMTKPWKDKGGDVSFTGTRNITADLTVRVEGNNPPDVAIPAEIGLFKQFIDEGKLISLDQCPGLQEMVKADYPQSFVDLGTVNGKLYGFFMKADTKATVWYNPHVFKDNNVDVPSADSSYDDLVQVSEKLKSDGIAPWSIGVESAEASGWPGSDWLQQIILNGPDGEALYDGLIDGSIPFTDQRVKDAWKKFGDIALADGFTSEGGATGINATNFQDATYPPFENPPKAAMTFLGGFASGFITDQFPDAKPGTDFDFFTFPGGKVTGGANIVYAFNNDPATCSFLRYMASSEAQDIWVKAGGFTSVNSKVSLEDYPSDIARKQAKQLLDAATFRFDLDDAIGGDLQTTYFAGVTEYLADPSKLDSILQQIEGARKTP